jgi:hypothetical protein
MTDARCKELTAKVEELAPQLNAYIKTLERRSREPKPKE